MIKTCELMNKGKVAGNCPKCDIVRGDWEVMGTKCTRCQHVYLDDPVIKDGK